MNYTDAIFTQTELEAGLNKENLTFLMNMMDTNEEYIPLNVCENNSSAHGFIKTSVLEEMFSGDTSVIEEFTKKVIGDSSIESLDGHYTIGSDVSLYIGYPVTSENSLKTEKKPQEKMTSWSEKLAESLKMKRNDLALHLNVNCDDISNEGKFFLYKDESYLVYSLVERTNAVAEYFIEDFTKYYFSYDFLSRVTGHDIEQLDNFEELKSLSKVADEDGLFGHEKLLRLIKSTIGLHGFVRECAKIKGGLGYYISNYDKCEIRTDNNLYIYRCF